MLIACGAPFLSGVAMPRRSLLLLVILPLVTASALTMILDLDSPGSGWIKVSQSSTERVQQQIYSGS